MIDTSFWKAGEIQPSFLANIDKAYRDEAKAVFLCLMQKKKSQVRLNLRLLAEMVGILPRAKQQQRVAFADFSAAPWQGFEKSERCPNNSSLFLPQAAVVVVALG